MREGAGYVLRRASRHRQLLCAQIRRGSPSHRLEHVGRAHATDHLIQSPRPVRSVFAFNGADRSFGDWMKRLA